MRFALIVLLIFSIFLISFGGPRPVAQEGGDTLRLPEEKHLRNVRQLTFGGENAEAYFSADGKQLIFQSTRGN